VAKTPLDHGALVLNSLISFQLGEYSAAADLAHMALHLRPHSGEQLKILGEIHYRQQQYAQARTYWQAYAKTAPNDPEAGFALVWVAYRQRDRDLLEWAARHLAAMKGTRSWEHMLGYLDTQRRKNELVLSENPQSVVPLIKRGLGAED
jgi:tetratricopeptide (TPR) repeat protein